MKKKLIPTKDRPATSISMRINLDLLDKLKRVAVMKGMTGYQSLIKYYIGQGLLRDIDLVRRIEQLHPQIIEREDGARVVELPYDEYVRLRDTVEDLEGLLELRRERDESADAPTRNLRDVAKELGLE